MKTIIKRLSVVLLVLTSMCWPTMADQWGHEKADSYTVYKKGDGVYHFKLLVTRRRPGTDNFVWSAGAISDTGEQNGKGIIWIEKPNQEKDTIVEFSSAFMSAVSSETGGWGRPEFLGVTYFRTLKGGSELFNARIEADTPNRINLPATSGTNNERAYFLEFDWYAPVEMAGYDNVKICCKVNCKGNPHQNYGYSYSTVQANTDYSYTKLTDERFPDGFTPQPASIQQPMPAIDMGDGKAQPGQMLLMLTAQQHQVHSYRLPDEANYTELEDFSYAPAIYIPISDEERHSIEIDTKLLYNGGRKELIVTSGWYDIELGRGIWDYSNTYEHKTANSVDVPAYHRIYDFRAGMRRLEESGLRDGAIELTWKIAHPKERDAFESDMFEIQRDTLPDFSTAETIGAVNYNANPSEEEMENDTLIYRFVDASPEVRKGNNESDWHFYYRIRRVSTSMWDWEEPGINTDRLFLSGLAAKTDIQSSYENFVCLAGLHGAVQIAEINTWEDTYVQDRKLKIWFGLERANTYYDGTPIYLVKKMISELHKDTIVQEILIPQDSIRYLSDEGYWTVNYTDVASIPCVYYEYSARMDTAASTIRCIEGRTHGAYNRFEVTFSFTRIPNRGFYSGGMTLDRDTAVSFATKTNPSSVFLKWGTKGGAFDYYTIRRRLVGETAWTTIADNQEDLFYDDHSSPVGRDCEYLIIGTEVCDSIVLDSITLVGRRYEYGSIAGYVMMPNGQAYAGVNVTLQCDSAGHQVTTSMLTDEKGHYKFDHLFYSESGITYTVFPTSTNAYDNFGQIRQVDLSGWSAEPENINFTNSNAVKFSGRVLYEHSTVPVHHCQFLVNGQLALNANGTPYETDASGNFDLMVPAGSTTIRGVMEGHHFLNDGYFLIGGDSLLPLTATIAEARLYDRTKVTVVGHVAGGTIEGNKAWGDLQAKNNLGDNLTLVFELEGDNISHLVHYEDERSEVDTTYAHPLRGQTAVEMTKKRVIVHPDSVTGEYRVELFPVRWKLVQATAQGYSTLLPAGKTSEALNLIGNELTADTLRMGGQTLFVNRLNNIIYRSPISLTYQQLYYGMKVDYLGEPQLIYATLNGSHPVSIIERDSTGAFAGYMFGAPVFQSGQKYTYIIHAHEDYYYNNQLSHPLHDQVMLKDIDVRVINGMNKKNDVQTVHLHDVTGDGRVTVMVNNPTFTQQGAEALRQIEMEAEVDGLYVHAEPIAGFITATEEKHGVDAVVTETSMPTLQEVINDPYGSTSSAYVDAGVKYTAHQNLKFSASAGLTFNLTNGSSNQFVSGISAGIGPFLGQVNNMSTLNSHNIPISTGTHATANYDYTYSLSNRVSTSSDKTMTGAKADVYIGTEWRYYMARADAVTLIDSAMYAMKQPAFQSGQLMLLTESLIDGKPYYLVRGENLVFGAQPMESHFAYTQDHIMRVIIPTLERQRDNLILMGVDSTAAVAMANQQHKAVYVSDVEVDNPLFGYSYIIYEANTDNCDNTDKVALFNQQIAKWQGFIYDNEKRKLTILQKGKLMGDYSITYGASRTFSESVSHAGYWSGFVFDGVNLGYDRNAVKQLDGSNSTSNMGIPKDKDGKDVLDPNALPALVRPKDSLEFHVKVFSFESVVKVAPKVNISFSRDVNTTDSDTKSAGFTLSMNNEGYEDIAVYRLTDNSFNDEAEYDRESADGLSIESAEDQGYLYANYVFVRKGGATRCPYEAEEKTLFYKPGTTLAPATVKIDDPHLELSTRMVDNVPSDQDVSIVVTMSNQSTYNPDVISTDFVLYVDDDTNPDGLQFFIDGTPLGEGRSFFLSPGASTQKTLVIRRGTAYDYNDIKLVLQHGCQRTNVTSTTFSVHYEPVSCPVALSLPVQNWLMNTLSPSDRNGFYIPVEITGFNTQYDNFDHLELQYKLAVESDDRYVTLCSYYADSTLLKLASGEKQMIDGATIRTSFYGERDPMEQQYDLRAVSYCRLGTSFVTRSSEVKHGVKDTRVPQLFGTATPANGILRVGDYISIPFSENIAANYLDADNNFQITGYTNTSVITGSTSLNFEADPAAYAATELTRNLAGKDITFDLMVLPEQQGRSMSYMMHGCDDDLIAFGQHALGQDQDGRERIALDLEMDLGNEIYHAISDTLPLSGNWMRVAAVYHHETGKVDFYCGTDQLGYLNHRDSLPAGYSCTGRLYLGNHPTLNGMDGYRFSGRMLEARLWNRALSHAEITNTNMRYLTGYEQGLLAYYPLNEGRNEYAEDKASGARMYLHGINWATPEGKAMHLDGHQLLLEGSFFSSTNINDYSMSMWFREAEEMTEGEGTNLFRSGNFRITLHPDRIHLQSDQFGTDGWGEYMDGGWHQLTLSVNRALGTSALYVDGRSVAQFSSALIGAPSASVAEVGPMKGSVDEMTFWETALPENYIRSFYGHTPNDEELALKTHLSFTQRRENSSGIYETVYNPYNCRIKRNRDGHIIARSEDDRVVTTSDAEAQAWLTDGNAPVNEKGDLTKMDFNWIGRDNELVINLTMLDKEINKQNVFITVRDVEDLHGNPMPSPLTWTLFIDRNQLRWSKPYIQETVHQGEERIVSIDLINEGGTTGNYQITNMPWWLTADFGEGSLSPLEQTPIELTISDQLNPGEYDDFIYLNDGSGLSEPLRIHLTVEALQPGWDVDMTKVGSEVMGLFAQVMIEGARGRSYFATDPRDIVAAFVGNNCVGTQNIQMLGQQSLVIMNIYNNAASNGQVINFRYWQAATGKVYALRPEGGDITYDARSVVGSPDAPELLKSTELLTQQIALEPGWNWLSLYVDPMREGNNFSSDLDGLYDFTSGDMMVCDQHFMSYSKPVGRAGAWSGNALHFYPDSVYFAHVSKAGQIGVIGSQLPDSALYVDLRAGWNYLPYKLSSVMDVTTALAGYADNVKSGDIIKSYRAFAMYSSAINAWIGSLTHLKPGEGYMLYRQDSTSVRMFYQPVTSVLHAPVRREVATAPARYNANLPMVLSVPEAKAGDRLQALVGDVLLAEAEADQEGRFWLLMNAAEEDNISFRFLSEEGEETVRQSVPFRSEMPGIGSADHPYLLRLGAEMADVYPSPFSDHITFSARAEAGDAVRLALFDAVGRCVWERSCVAESDLFSFTLSGTEAYPSGVYIASISIGTEIVQVKLIKE